MLVTSFDASLVSQTLLLGAGSFLSSSETSLQARHRLLCAAWLRSQSRHFLCIWMFGQLPSTAQPCLS